MPWLVRNLLAIGQLSDPTLVINGMYPDFRFQGRPETHGFPDAYDPMSGQLSRSVGALLAEILRRFLETPLAQLEWYLLGKPRTLFDWSCVQGVGEFFIYEPADSPHLRRHAFLVSASLMKVLHTPAMLAAAGGALVALAGARADWPSPA